MNPLAEPAVRALRRHAVSTAQALASKRMPLIDGVRELARLRFELLAWERHPDFARLAAIAGQADHLPSSSMRGLCSAQWLAACDAEASEIESRHGAEVQAACDRIAAWLNGPGTHRKAGPPDAE